MNLFHLELIDRSVVEGSFSTTVLRYNWCDVKSDHFCCTVSCARAVASSQIWSKFNLINIPHWEQPTTQNTLLSASVALQPSSNFRGDAAYYFCLFLLCPVLLAVVSAFFCFSFSALINWWRSFGQKYATKLHVDAGLFDDALTCCLKNVCPMILLPVLMLF